MAYDVLSIMYKDKCLKYKVHQSEGKQQLSSGFQWSHGTARFQEQQEPGSEGHHVKRVWRISKKKRRKTERKGERRGRERWWALGETSTARVGPESSRRGNGKMADRTGGDWSSRGRRLLLSSKKRGGNEGAKLVNRNWPPLAFFSVRQGRDRGDRCFGSASVGQGEGHPGHRHKAHPEGSSEAEAETRKVVPVWRAVCASHGTPHPEKASDRTDSMLRAHRKMRLAAKGNTDLKGR